MQVFEVTANPPRSEESQVLAIGKFDGVHIGHQAILHEAKHHIGSGMVSVMSFSPHPAWVFSSKPGYDRYLTPFTEKVRLLQSHGVDRLYNVLFSHAYADTVAETFVLEHLAVLQLQRVVVGFDFRFGRGGTADVDRLQQLCNQIAVPVSVVQPVEENGVKVSSSQIRAHLEHGRVEAADALLGRPYALVGTVVHGDAIGRTLGFPTANLADTGEYVLPKTGVYAVTVEIVGHGTASHWFGVLNAGFRPTVDGRSFRIEVHLLGFEGDLYGKSLRVSFLRRVRDEKKFDGIESLKRQIAADTEFVKSMLGQ
jgi:riboflavin kinase / FMN adenylyltransferase